MAVRLNREQASNVATPLGWRYVLGAFVCLVPVESFAGGVEVLARVSHAAGSDAREHLKADLRGEAAVLTVQTISEGHVTDADVDIVRRVTAALRECGSTPSPRPSPQTRPRCVQILEIGIDAMDIPSIRPFWKAAMGYGDEGENGGPTAPLVDPLGQGPAIWFQQMDVSRPQRNRIHFDISVPHDEAEARMQAITAAGGRLVYDAEAPAFWVFADPEGNEICVTTWQGRD